MQQTFISVPEAFAIREGKTSKLGVEGYHIVKTYADPLKIIEDRELATKKGAKPFKKPTKRGSYLDDEAKIHKPVPGPGKYPFKEQWSSKSTLKKRYSERLTDTAQWIIKQKKEKRPPPGHYQIFKSLKQLDKERKEMSVRKIKLPEKINFLDEVQLEASLKPGVGKYNVRQRAKTEMSFSKRQIKPEQMRKKHIMESKKKRPKRPTSTTYSPKPADYSLFSTMIKTASRNGFGKTVRFKTTPSGSGLPPAKYSVVQQWRGKASRKLERHGLETLSKGINKSVYY